MPRTSSALVLLLFLCLAAAPADAAVYYDGVIIDRPNKYDAYPTHLFIDGVHHVWWCSNSNETADDGIFLATKASSLGPNGWSTPEELFNHTDSPWATHHVCDPSVLKARFLYGGNEYAYALYYTADDASRPEGVNNSIGVAFSNNLTSWVAHSEAVILPDNGFEGNYGAGQSGTGFGPALNTIYHTYFDATNGHRVRLKHSTDGLTFGPTPSIDTFLTNAGRTGTDGREADIAYNPLDNRWYAAITSTDPWGGPLGEVRMLRSSALNSLTASWQLLGIINKNLTGEELHHNPGLAKNEDGTLYIDGSGRAYVFMGSGPDFPDFLEWKVTQARFDIATTESAPTAVILDVNSVEPLGLTVSNTGGTSFGSYSLLTAAVAIPGGTAANNDDLWNVQDDFRGKGGLNGFVSAGTEDAPQFSAVVSGLAAGTYKVYGRYATAPLQSPPDYYGIYMGLSPATMTRYDQTTSDATVVGNWSNWQEWEVELGNAVVDDGKITVYLDDTTVTKAAVWTGLRLVLQ